MTQLLGYMNSFIVRCKLTVKSIVTKVTQLFSLLITSVPSLPILFSSMLGTTLLIQLFLTFYITFEFLEWTNEKCCKDRYEEKAMSGVTAEINNIAF